MTEQDFMAGKRSCDVQEGQATWQSPSNIALVKYWGKKENQIPANPSISFTLDTSRTTTVLQYKRKEEGGGDYDVELFFHGKKEESFEAKVLAFLKRIEKYMPFVKEYSFTIETSNSFPHSSGIASSASGMSALALGLMSLEKELNPEMTEQHFFRKASFIARLGSGSACRSIEGGLVVWGNHQTIPTSSNLFGVEYPHEVHEVFSNYQDTILLVETGAKQVSSTAGHDLMQGHPFAEKRFVQAHQNLEKLQGIFAQGDLPGFIEVVESEALTLHAMMMTSTPYFLLMKPKTLEIIQRVMEFRKNTRLHLCFTLDAGANVHLLYPEREKKQILEFIKRELLQYCQNEQFITDRVGSGARKPA